MKPCKCSICVLTDGLPSTMTDDAAAAICCTPVGNITGHRLWLAEQAAKPAPVKVAAIVAPKTRPVFSGMVRGCGRCRELGRRCQQCRHDSY